MLRSAFLFIIVAFAWFKLLSQGLFDLVFFKCKRTLPGSGTSDWSHNGNCHPRIVLFWAIRHHFVVLDFSHQPLRLLLIWCAPSKTAFAKIRPKVKFVPTRQFSGFLFKSMLMSQGFWYHPWSKLRVLVRSVLFNMFFPDSPKWFPLTPVWFN